MLKEHLQANNYGLGGLTESPAPAKPPITGVFPLEGAKRMQQAAEQLKIDFSALQEGEKYQTLSGVNSIVLEGYAHVTVRTTTPEQSTKFWQAVRELEASH